MTIEKLFVLLLCVVTVQCYRSKYCDICKDHTLCKYPVGGATTACNSFDRESTLTDEDITDIVDRINARRNLVAIGSLKKFPQAANMRKMRWSTELASFAQRWADQCDTSVRPNKEDECRDLVGMEVGQNIASVVGPAPGLHVKSFVDMWFMLKLHYTGNVVYYNRSRDDKTSYFTQLIWADTEYVGCGRITFFNLAINTVVDRLVCNFAPKGNNHGKPVYTLGYPATQCPKSMSPAREYPGLCKQDLETATEIAPDTSPNSLLRMLDFVNNSETPNLDPNNLKSSTSNNSDNNDTRKQNTRNAFSEIHNGGVKRDSFHMQNPLNNPENFKGHQLTPERGHSRMYHGHPSKMEPIQNFQTTQQFPEIFQRFDMTTQPNPFSIQVKPDPANSGRRLINEQNDFPPDGRRNFNGNLCTRKPKCGDCCPKPPCMADQCTRGQSHGCNSCAQPSPCDSCVPPPLRPPPVLPPPLLPPPPVPCCPPPPPPPPPPPCSFSMKCPACPAMPCPPPPPCAVCAKRRSQGDSQDMNKNTQFNYYDLLPNMGLKSGDENRRKLIDNSEIEDDLQYKSRESELRNQVKEIAGNLEATGKIPQDSYDIFYSSERKRRDFEDQMTFKPFWQMDEYNQRRPAELKSLRYTTLADKRNKKHRWTTRTLRVPTESITIKLDEGIDDTPHRNRVSEKYLSFEELMHLRKLSTVEGLGEIDYEARRAGDEYYRRATTKKGAPTTTTKKAPTTTTKKAAPATTKAPITTKAPTATTKAPTATIKPVTKAPVATTIAATTAERSGESTEYTANTQFLRVKQCTRKITCTWTAIMMVTDFFGSPITGVEAQGMIVGVDAIGSRTPPGYVEGCTRTSTCTRDFMDRNKMPETTPSGFDGNGGDGADGGADGDGGDGGDGRDEDYCEKRSLDVQRRNLDDTGHIEIEKAITETPVTLQISHVISRGVTDTPMISKKDDGCICYDDNIRVKRNEDASYKNIISNGCGDTAKDDNSKNQDEDLLNMINTMSISKPNTHKCPCNSTHTMFDPSPWFIFLNYFLASVILCAC